MLTCGRYGRIIDVMGIATSDVRARAIAAYEAGNGSQAEIARFYGVDISTFQRWLQRYRQIGLAAPLPRGHNPPALSEEQMLRLGRLVQQRPDATLGQLRESLGVACSLVAIHNTLKRLGYRFKKNSSGQRTRTPGY
jgi:transposase